MMETGEVTARRVHGRSKLNLTPKSATVVFFETVEDFAAEDINEGHRPSISKKIREGAEKLINMVGLPAKSEIMILLERLLQGIAEEPNDPYFRVRDWMAFGYDHETKLAYNELRKGLRKVKFPANHNGALHEQFEMPAFEELAKEVSLEQSYA